MRLFILVNPRAGNGAGDLLGRSLEGHGRVEHIRFDRLSEQLAEAVSFDCIVVAGGDGTISSVLTSQELPERPVLPIPLGTANDLARDLGIARALKGVQWGEIPAVVSTWASRPFATWQVEVDGSIIPFSNYCSLGFEGAVVQDFQNWRTRTKYTGRMLNRAMYSLFGLRHLSARTPKLDIECDTSTFETGGPCKSLIFANVRSYLGLGFSNRTGSPHDQKLECVTTKSVLDYLRIIASPSRIIPPPPLLCCGKVFSLKGVPLGTPLQVDGEPQKEVSEGSLCISFRKMVSVWAPSRASTADELASHR